MEKKNFERGKIEFARGINEAGEFLAAGMFELEDILALPDDTPLSAVREKLADAYSRGQACEGILDAAEDEMFELLDMMEARTLRGRLKRLFQARKEGGTA